MATPYENVYKKFLSKITDFNLPEIDDYTLDEMLQGWLNSAIVRIRKCQHDLSKRNDEVQEFDEDLSDLEVELLACGMTVAWLDQFINSTEYTMLFVGGKEEKFYSPSSQLAELRNLREQTLLEMNRLHNYYTYTNNSYFDD